MNSLYHSVRRRIAAINFLRRRPAPPVAPPAKPAPPFGPHPDWPRLLENDWPAWEEAVKAAEAGPPVLIATSAGGYSPGVAVESLLAVALTLRGARVHVLLCDRALPACMQAMIHQLPAEEFVRDGIAQHLCQSCFGPAERMFQALGLPLHLYSDWVDSAEAASAERLAQEIAVAEIDDYRLDGLAVGEHALAGALRYFARGDLAGEPGGEAILRRYFHASLLTAHVARRLLAAYPFVSACFHHGIYVPQGLVGEAARAQAVPVVNWTQAYRKRCFIFAHHDTYHHALMDEPVANWEDMPWSDQLEAEVMDYLQSRRQGTQDWIWFHEKPQEDLARIKLELGIDFERPCIGMLTNVMWDAQLHYRANAFANMLDWAVQTIDYFARRPDLQLVIRIHPAEVRGTLISRQPLLAEIQKAFPTLPPNVFVIPPESQISTYVVMEQCDAVIIYGTKTGVELTSAGKPVIVGGEAWIRNKGLTLDATSPESYFALLDRLPLATRLDEAVTRRARKYAYHFFLRRMIPLEMLEPRAGWPPYAIQIAALAHLLPGRSRGLDIVCDGILNGTEFIYPAEQLAAAPQPVERAHA